MDKIDIKDIDDRTLINALSYRFGLQKGRIIRLEQFLTVIANGNVTDLDKIQALANEALSE